MLTDEQKELLIWGGGSLVVVIVLAVAASSYGSTVIGLNNEIRGLHATYRQQYQEADGRLPADQARTRITQARDDQQAGLAAIEGQVLAALGGNVVQTIRPNPNATASFTYNEVVGEVDDIYQSLRAKATRLNVGRLPDLPLQGSEEIVKGDDLASEQRRSLQLAQVQAVRRVMDFCLDRGPNTIGDVDLDGLMVDDIQHPAYAVFGVEMELSCDYATADRIVRDLREPKARLALAALSMAEDEGIEEAFDLSVTVRVIVPWPRAWDADVLLGKEREAAAAAGGRGRSTGGRGGGR